MRRHCGQGSDLVRHGLAPLEAAHETGRPCRSPERPAGRIPLFAARFRAPEGRQNRLTRNQPEGQMGGDEKCKSVKVGVRFISSITFTCPMKNFPREEQGVTFTLLHCFSRTPFRKKQSADGDHHSNGLKRIPRRGKKRTGRKTENVSCGGGWNRIPPGEPGTPSAVQQA